MTFDKFKNDEGYTIDGIFYGDAEDVLGSRMKFCGCGDPDVALRYTRDILTLIERQTADILSKTESDSSLKDYFHSDGERWFVFYMLDSLDLTEHGTSVSMGGWLTQDGKNLLADLNEYFENPSNDQKTNSR